RVERGDAFQPRRAERPGAENEGILHVVDEKTESQPSKHGAGGQREGGARFAGPPRVPAPAQRGCRQQQPERHGGDAEGQHRSPLRREAGRQGGQGGEHICKQQEEAARRQEQDLHGALKGHQLTPYQRVPGQGCVPGPGCVLGPGCVPGPGQTLKRPTSWSSSPAMSVRRCTDVRIVCADAFSSSVEALTCSAPPAVSSEMAATSSMACTTFWLAAVMRWVAAAFSSVMRAISAMACSICGPAAAICWAAAEMVLARSSVVLMAAMMPWSWSRAWPA